MENPTHSFTETNLVLQLIEESQIKSKTVMSWCSRKKKKGIFVPFILSKGIFFKICVLSQYKVYWIHLQNIHTFTYQKTLLLKLLLLVFKIVKGLHLSFIITEIMNHPHWIFLWHFNFICTMKLLWPLVWHLLVFLRILKETLPCCQTINQFWCYARLRS